MLAVASIDSHRADFNVVEIITISGDHSHNRRKLICLDKKTPAAHDSKRLYGLSGDRCVAAPGPHR